MTKVGCWSIAIDRSCHIGPSRTSNCFDLNYPEDALYILYQKYILLYQKYILLYQKDGQSNRFLDSIEAQRGEVNRVPSQITRDM